MPRYAIIRSYKKGETPKRATLTFIEEIPGDELERILDWLSGEEVEIFAAKKILTVNIVPKAD